MRLAFLLAGCVGAAAAAQEKKAPADPPAPKAHVIGLTLERPIPGDTRMPRATVIKLVVECPKKQILGLDHEKCKLAALTDDKGTDLTQGKYPARVLNNNELQPLVGGSLGMMHLHLPSTPAPGARQITLKGTLAVVCGSGEKTAEAKGFALKKDEAVEVGPAKVRVTEVSPNGFTRLAYQNPGHAVKRLDVFDADGKPVQAAFSGGLVPLAGPYKTPTPTVSVFGKLDRVNLRVTYCPETEVVIVPLDLSFGLNLE